MRYVQSSYTFNGITVTNTWIPSEKISKFQPITQVYGVIYDLNGNILICKEKPQSSWQLPGGTPEDGETLEQTLVRELREEVDVTVSKIFPLGVQKVFMPNNPNKKAGDLFYQARYIAFLDTLHEQTPDPDSGHVWERKIIPAEKVTEYIKWGKSGDAMFNDALSLFNRL